MCSSCNQCFSLEEKKKLVEKGWSPDQIKFAEGTIIEDKIKALI